MQKLLNKDELELLHETALAITPLCRHGLTLVDSPGIPVPTSYEDRGHSIPCSRCGKIIFRAIEIKLPTCRDCQREQKKKQFYASRPGWVKYKGDREVTCSICKEKYIYQGKKYCPECRLKFL